MKILSTLASVRLGVTSETKLVTFMFIKHGMLHMVNLRKMQITCKKATLAKWKQLIGLRIT